MKSESKDFATVKAAAQFVAPLMKEPDLKVAARQYNGEVKYGIHIKPEETLGHYADWLGIGYTQKLRKLNRIRSEKQLQVGHWLTLPIKSEEAKEEFEKKREEYHRTLVDEFRQHYDIIGLDTHTVSKGDSLWRIAEEYELPYWVLTRYNPDKLSPRIGDRVFVPSVKAKKPQ